MNEPVPAWPSDRVRHSLLERFRPEVVYDSREAFTAASVSEMLDDPYVELRRADGTLVARAGPGESDLNTEFFTDAGYRNEDPYAVGDHISFPASHHDYRTQAREMERERPELANVVYGHFAQDRTPERRFWLQFWYFMLYNDAQLLGRFGLHEGDWEMVQLRLVGSGPEWDDPQIDLAVYAQHTYAQSVDVDDIDLSPDGAPVAFCALGSHAHYRERDLQDRGAVGRRRRPRPAHPPDPRGSRRRSAGLALLAGDVGPAIPAIPAIESSSPRGPREHGQWEDPNELTVRVWPAQPAQPARVKSISIRRALRNHPQIDFDFEPIAEPAAFPGSLVATITRLARGPRAERSRSSSISCWPDAWRYASPSTRISIIASV